ncbi:MAG: amidinotransferase [Chloroflexi bacterium RBG_19FT_COMBO_49_13]|nr:MAG: amidinotransferase [Chloroflexi bacterium RBG_16_47_49]OGO61083.1 MAG: amidinotransferase [Chloroflexi bacterium RBG_19FT_COMBO_49_13]
MFTHAITRLPGENFADGLTTSTLGRPNYHLILKQHQAYRQALQSLGLEVILLPAESAYPDAYFVEDPAIVTPNLAVITCPGAPSRQGEGSTLEPVLKQYRPVVHIDPPGTVDGGDILMVESHFFIGLSERTNREGAAQLAKLLAVAGHTSETVLVASGLHLKSGVNFVGKDTLLITSSLADNPAFVKHKKILLDPTEEYAANTLYINDTLLMPEGFPKTHAKLDRLGMRIIELDVSEVRKMDGGLTCMSLRF